MGRQWDDLEAQARWVAYELREGSESGAYAKIQKARTPEEAALLVSRHYERPRPSKANNRKRMSEARRFHLMMQGEGK